MDTRKLSVLKSFNEHEIRYLVIGALALPAHGHVRTTADLDIFVDPSAENLQRVRRALEEMRYPVWQVTDHELATKKTLFTGFDPKLDIHPFVAGADWESTFERRIASNVGGVRFFVPALEDVISMKRAAGRPKDLEDLRYLEEIKRQKDLGASAPPSQPPPP